MSVGFSERKSGEIGKKFPEISPETLVNTLRSCYFLLVERDAMKKEITIQFSVLEFYNVINALRESCGCAECFEITNEMMRQRKEAAAQ